MSATATEQAQGITLSERAAQEVLTILKDQGLEGAALRLYVAGGGCSGLQYGMTIAEEVEDGDQEFLQHEVRILIDQASLRYVSGSSIDWVDGPEGGGFRIDNPNSVRGSGCGPSSGSDDSPDGAAYGCSGCPSRG
ncbi:MAG TPA: iron-sulfur cluster assembly accessory protein [Chthonomonadales bacterium]|nr:iron-sulfur cluster assembly accessory protein [Chthonomonadales bacterium]